MMDSLRRSFTSHGSYKHMHRTRTSGSAATDPSSHEDQRPILSDHDDIASSTPSSAAGTTMEVIVKIDGGDGEDQQSTPRMSNDYTNTITSNNTNNNNNNDHGPFWRGSSYEFWKNDPDKQDKKTLEMSSSDESSVSFSKKFSDDFRFASPPQTGPGAEHPPSKLIGQFLNKQIASDGEKALDMDMEIEELLLNNSNENSSSNPPTVDNNQIPRHDLNTNNNNNNYLPGRPAAAAKNIHSREMKVSFQDPQSAADEIASKEEDDSEDDESSNLSRNIENDCGSSSEVLRCTSSSTNASFQRRSTLLRAKTKSRLLDPPREQLDRKSGRIPKSSGPFRSGLLSFVRDEDDEDPFCEEDVPENFKKEALDAMTIIQWVILLMIVAALVCSLSIPALKDKTLWNLRLWKWEVLILVLICGRLVSGWGIRLVVFLLERNFVLRKRVLYFVYGLRRAVQNCLWLGQVLIAWHLLFDQKVKSEPNTEALWYVTKILVCLLVGNLMWLLKTLMVKVLASSFHVSTYFDRIQESLFNQYVIETLSGPPLIEMQNAEEEEERMMAEVTKLQNATGITVPPDLKASAFPPARSGRALRSEGIRKSAQLRSVRLSRAMTKTPDDGITIDHLHKLNHKNVSAWNMKRLMKIVRHGFLSTLDEQILDTAQEDESAMQIRSEVEAKIAARKIFQNVSRPGSKSIYLKDLLRFMGEDEALKTISLFELPPNKRGICRIALKNWVVDAFRERRALALTLNDTKTAVNKLHKVVNVIVGVFILIIWLVILGVATSKFILYVSSQVVILAFIFGNTLKTIFESIIFLFVMHPYDVGDRCEIDGVQMVVEEMNILTTIFLRYDNLKIIFPNSVLSTKQINNFYRSPDMGDAVEFCVSIATPGDKISLMRQRILGYIESKTDHWHPSPMIILKDMENLKKLKFAVWLSHRMNHQNMGERWSRRAELVEEMVRIFRDLDIQYRLLPRDINVLSMPVAVSGTN